MAAGRVVGRRGRRISNASMSQKVVGTGPVFLETTDGQLLQIINPNNPNEVSGVQTRKLTAEQAEQQRRRFLRGRAGKVAGRGKAVPRSRVQASQIDELRRRERSQRDEEDERRTTNRFHLGRRIV